MSVSCKDSEGNKDTGCQEYVNKINEFLVQVWTNTDNDITKVDLADASNVEEVVNKLLESKRQIDTIRTGLMKKNEELRKIQSSLESVKDTSNAQDQVEEKINKHNEKVLHYARLLQSADGQQKHGVEKNYRLSLASILPIKVEMGRAFPYVNVPKHNMVLYSRIMSIILFLLVIVMFIYIMRMLRNAKLKNGSAPSASSASTPSPSPAAS